MADARPSPAQKQRPAARRVDSPGARARPAEPARQQQNSEHRPEWANMTTSELPNKPWVVCWLEEVVPYEVFTKGSYNATAKSLICCAVVRAIFMLLSFLPGPFEAWGMGPELGEYWNLWGPQQAPSLQVVTVAVGIYLSSVILADYMPELGKAASDKATYTDFKKFWHMYVGEHRNPLDRVCHVFEFFGVLVFMASSHGRLVAFSLTLGLGALLTRPLLHVNRPKVESDLMYLIGAAAATFYGVPVSYSLGYAVWLAFDYTGHAYLGKNKGAAAFLGKHYLAWALVGQSWFSTQVLLNFPTEVQEAIEWWKAAS